MHDIMPISAVTDGHEAVQEALPQSGHGLCTWHLERDARSNVNDASFISDFKVCMEILSQYEFELKWKALVDKFKLSGNSWMQKIYKWRHMWEQAYLRGHFWAGLHTTKVCEGIHEHLSLFLQHGLRLYQFIRQYDRAVDNIIRCNERLPVSGDIIMRMVRCGSLASSFSSLCYLGSKADMAYNLLSYELRKLKHKIHECSATSTSHANNSGAAGTTTAEKDAINVSKREPEDMDIPKIWSRSITVVLASSKLLLV
ncbi:hypothetical protein L6164_010830 [Bauhinia variegata]|uniref:Uncharacterized protein n=1 Tax=Bauhinia variegata TaxID=167791 RepID=A0ACB9P6B3_BAUVA|nr:hypothetical protein L6164_010830 [Bauhinia variegata]